MTTIYGANANSYWKTRVDYSVSNTNGLTATVTANLYIARVSDCKPDMGDCRPCYLSCNGTTQNFYPTGEHSLKGSTTTYYIGQKVFTVTKGETAKTVTLSGYIKKTGGLSALRGNSTASASISIPAKHYVITFNANGGATPPPSQNKTHNVALTLTNGIPTRSGYDFVEWNTNAEGTGTSYASGATLPASVNQDTILYAIWHRSYAPPTISDLRAYRVGASTTGVNPSVLSSGTKCYCDFTYTASVSPDTTLNSVTIKFGSASAINASTSGSKKYGYSASGFLPTTSSIDVVITVKVTDYKGNAYTYTYSTYISTENYVFDAFKGSQNSEEYQSFAIGGIARDFTNAKRSPKGNFDVYMTPSFMSMAGEVKMWAGATVPDGWLLCNGAEVSKADYPKLYEAIGNLWGTPSSSSNFLLPNFNGKVPVGYDATDADFDTVGKRGGEKTHTLTVNEMPSHAHTQRGSTSGTISGSGRTRAGYTTEYSGSTTANTGGGKSHNNLQPYAVIKYIICAI